MYGMNKNRVMNNIHYYIIRVIKRRVWGFRR